MRIVARALLALSGLMATSAMAMTLTSKPLYLQNRVDPNLFFQVDDSGSMDWDILTLPHWYYSAYWDTGDQTFVDSGLWRGWDGSARRNFAYWHNNSDNAYYGDSSYPAFEGYAVATLRDWRVRSADFNVLYYNPSVDYTPWPDPRMGDANITAARSNPQNGSAGYALTRSLDPFVYEVWIDDAGYNGSAPDWVGGVPNYVTPRGPGGEPLGNGLVDLWDSH
ncbi:MAG: hypothetical protein H7831_14410, partial [Magnetococcus sp. WYHC-3]